MNKNSPLIFILLIGGISFFLSGCAGLIPQKTVEISAKAASLAREASSINQGLATVKGTAHMILTDNNTRQQFKIAWAALLPDKIRITVLESGFPVETIFADGEKVTFVSHTGRHGRHTINAPNPSLKSMVSLPIRIRDIITLLSGRLPLEPFDREEIIPAGESDSTTLLLSRKWRGTLARILFDNDGQIVQFEPVARNGKSSYQVSRSDLKPQGPYLIPGTTFVQDSSGRTMTLKIISFYPDLPVNASIFVLTETEQ
ncbi:MAG: hypothetical protein RBQ72_03470 [Desulfobacterium sp.]|jgi:outer membrane lipoprotein-sorting protein|nr:hypothetical protein [Desulfobacterium sp.]